VVVETFVSGGMKNLNFEVLKHTDEKPYSKLQKLYSDDSTLDRKLLSIFELIKK
jgi:hypothetical protein